MYRNGQKINYPNFFYGDHHNFFSLDILFLKFKKCCIQDRGYIGLQWESKKLKPSTIFEYNHFITSSQAYSFTYFLVQKRKICTWRQCCGSGSTGSASFCQIRIRNIFHGSGSESKVKTFWICHTDFKPLIQSTSLI